VFSAYLARRGWWEPAEPRTVGGLRTWCGKQSGQLVDVFGGVSHPADKTLSPVKKPIWTVGGFFGQLVDCGLGHFSRKIFG
jgi:hypothetical protein